jgi:hypothetical protein
LRILALIPPGNYSRSIYADMLRGLELAGHTIILEDVSPYVSEHQRLAQGLKGVMSDELKRVRAFYASHLVSLVTTYRCDLVVTLWIEPLMLLPWGQREGRIAGVFESMGVPTLHYWLDAPFWAYGGALLPLFDRERFTGPMHIHAVNNPGTAAEMRTVLNLHSVISAPYGVDHATFRPWDEIDTDFELMINTGPGDPPPSPRMLSELSRDDPDVEGIRNEEGDRARPRLIALLRDAGVEAQTAEGLGEAWVREQLRDPDRSMLDKFRAAIGARDGGEVERVLLRSASAPVTWARATALVRGCERWQRAFTTAYLSRRFRCVLVGGGAHGMKTSGWPLRGPCAGEVAYHELSAWYSRAHAALNVMRYHDDIGMNIRGLEASASGALVIERARSGLLERFTPGEQVLSFTRPGEAAHLLRDVLDEPDRLAHIAAGGRSRTLREHTWERRGGSLAAMAGDRLASLTSTAA